MAIPKSNVFMNESATKVKYYLLMIANPHSDSRAAMGVFGMIRQLDLLSGEDVDIFFPGFHKYESFSHDSADEVKAFTNELLLKNKKAYEDYHGRDPVYHTFCESTGDIYFNDPDFIQFVHDFEELCPVYEYLGRTELAILPTIQGEIQCSQVKIFDLAPFFTPRSEHSLEEFLVSLLKLMKKDECKDSAGLMPKADALYSKLCHATVSEYTMSYTDVVIRLDNEIIRHMNWKKDAEAFFISYSTKDEQEAYSMKYLLEKNGKLVWMAPDGIPSGRDYACAIPAAIRVTSRFVVLLSHNSAKSHWVRREIGKAVGTNKRIDGVLIKDFTIEDIRQYDHLDFMLENVQLRYTLNQLIDDSMMMNDFLNLFHKEQLKYNDGDPKKSIIFIILVVFLVLLFLLVFKIFFDGFY